MMIKKGEVWKVVLGDMLEGGTQLHKENHNARNVKDPHLNILGHMNLKEGKVT